MIHAHIPTPNLRPIIHYIRINNLIWVFNLIFIVHLANLRNLRNLFILTFYFSVILDSKMVEFIKTRIVIHYDRVILVSNTFLISKCYLFSLFDCIIKYSLSCSTHTSFSFLLFDTNLMKRTNSWISMFRRSTIINFRFGSTIYSRMRNIECLQRRLNLINTSSVYILFYIHIQ